MLALASSQPCAAAALPNASRGHSGGRRAVGALATLGALGWLAAACSTAAPMAGAADGGATGDDGGATADAGDPADAGPPPPDAGPWRHAVVIDGIDDFTDDERFATTTPGYVARVTWDDENLYLGYRGADVAAASAGTWLFAYLDVDPGQGTGAATGERYNTQRPVFPTGFGAEAHVRLQASGEVEDLKRFDGLDWAVEIESLAVGRSGDFVELAVPLAALTADGSGALESLGVTIFWLNETDLSEWAYGGLFDDAFVDGYHEELAIGRYLELDRAGAVAPADPSNVRP